MSQHSTDVESDVEYDSEGEVIPRRPPAPVTSSEPAGEEPSAGQDDAEEDGTKMSRKERKRLELQHRREEEIKQMQDAAERVGKEGDNPFNVTLEQDTIAEGSRNITLNKVSVSIGGKILFRETQVKFSAGSRYGVMGPNGRGKSTLLRLMATRELPIQQSLTLLLVEQEQEISGGDLSAVQAVIRSHKLQTEYMAEAEALRTMDSAKMTDEQLARLQFLEEELTIIGAQQAESKARRILFGLGFPTEWHDRPTQSFSGGWRKRIALASAVYIEPDVLMLDEPTNHLDLNAVIWLESYLSHQYSETARRPKTLLVVSHDAGFLDSVCTHMVSIENFKLNYFRGGYSTFHAQVQQRHAEVDKKYTLLQKQITEKKKNGWTNDKVDEWLKDMLLQGKVDQDVLEKRRDYVVNFPFKAPPALRDGCIVKLEDVSFRYGPEHPILFQDVNCSLWNDSRITLCGPNGIGKSTLLNLMTGVLHPTSGYITVNRQVRIGRYNQHFVDKLPLERTCVDYLRSIGAKSEEEARKLLGSFGLEGLVHKNMIATLSGGQKARVALAAISCELPHFLLFDEPTNHLDMESIDALCVAINEFKGGILVVTHDARLIQETNMQLWVAGDLNVKPFPGTLQEYKDHVRTLFEAEEAKKEDERIQKKADRELKLEAKAAGATVEEHVQRKRATEKAKHSAELDDFFNAISGSGEPKDKEKKEKKKDKKDKGEKELNDTSAPTAAGATSPSPPAAEGKEKEKKDKKDKDKKEKKDRGDGALEAEPNAHKDRDAAAAEGAKEKKEKKAKASA